MSTDLHERLHEAMVTTEIPSYAGSLVDAAVLHGHRTRRRRRFGAAAGLAAVAAAVVTATLLEPPPAPDPVIAVPASPTEVAEGGAVTMFSDVRVGSQELSVTFARDLTAPSEPAVLTLQRPARPVDSVATPVVAPTSIEVGDGPSWAAVDVVSDGVPTGQVVVFGLVPATGWVYVTADGRPATTSSYSDHEDAVPANLLGGRRLLVARVAGAPPGTSVEELTVTVTVESEDGVRTQVPEAP